MKYLKLFLYCIVGASTLWECDFPESKYGVPVVNVPANFANVLYINAAPDSVSLTFFLNNSPLSTIPFPKSLSYQNAVATSEQFRIPNVRFGVVGSDTVEASADLVLQTNLIGGANYTLFVTDTLARPFKKGSSFTSDQGGLRFSSLIADNLSVPAIGYSNIRFFNMAPGASTLYLTASGTPFTGVTAGRSYATTSGFTDFVTIHDGKYDLEIRADSTSGPILATAPGTDFSDGKIFTIYVTGKVVNSEIKVAYVINVVPNN
jgi:hypothetical protein